MAALSQRGRIEHDHRVSRSARTTSAALRFSRRTGRLRNRSSTSARVGRSSALPSSRRMYLRGAAGVRSTRERRRPNLTLLRDIYRRVTRCSVALSATQVSAATAWSARVPHTRGGCGAL